MPVHDWTRVDAGIFHGFHTVWIGAINHVLNAGLLPPGYYAMPEQHAGRFITDVLTLHASPAPTEPAPPWPPATGGTAVAEAPPKSRWKQVIEPSAVARRRSLAIRHVSGHRLIALVEILSPGNKDREDRVEEFATKAASALCAGVHLLMIDLFPPGPHDPQGMHAAILARLESDEAPLTPSESEPLTLASYVAGPKVVAYVEPAAVGAPLPEMALFLRPDRYIDIPLDATYQSAYADTPQVWREVLESPGRRETYRST
jgi:hypothetical protein